MAPSTRSKSASNTPVKGATVSALDTLATPTRKVPHCTKCNRPRAGHPRSGCPFVDGNTNFEAETDSDTDTSSNNLTNALGSLNIGSPANMEPKTPTQRKGRRSLGATPPSIPFEFEDMRQVRRERRKSGKAAAVATSQTLDSLSESDLETLLIPGRNDKDDEEEDDGEVQKGVRWNERLQMLSQGGTITTKKVSATGSGGKRVIMPCTFVTPSPWSSVASVIPPGQVEDDTSSNSSSASVRSTGTVIEVVSPSSTNTPRPLARTMSMEERAGFISHLEELSSAKAYMLSKADLALLKEQPPKGLYTKLLRDEDDEKKDVLVVGRNKQGMEELYQNLNAEKQRAKRGIDLSSAAGGAVVGAVATFTGLAFS